MRRTHLYQPTASLAWKGRLLCLAECLLESVCFARVLGDSFVEADM